MEKAAFHKRQPFLLLIPPHLLCKEAIMKFRFFLFFAIFSLIILLPLSRLVSQSSVPVQLREVATHLPNSLTVMNLALQPGFEDLTTLAMLRSVRGAKVVSVFCTNGESGDSDVRNQYPSQLAATLREEAYQASSVLEGEVRFLNLEDPGASASESDVWERWSKESLIATLEKLVLEVKPDIIVIAGDPRVKGKSPLRDALASLVLEVRDSLMSGVNREGRLPRGTHERWDVRRVFAEVKRGGISLDYSKVTGPLALLARKRAAEAIERYPSLAHQQSVWRRSNPLRYELLYGSLPKASTVKMLDQGLGSAPGKPLDQIHAALARLSSELVANVGSSAKFRSSRMKMLKGVVSLIDSVDGRFSQPLRPTPRQRKHLISWKRSLEQLRNLLLDVQVHFSIEHTVLSPRQLAHLTIDSVSGPPLKGRLEILFPSIEDDWIIDEARERLLPLRTGVAYRIVSPEKPDYHLPADLFGLERTSPRYDFSFFILHRGATREESFAVRTVIPLLFSPRHTLDILTPMVKADEGAEVIVRFTNNTYDGVADRIRIESDLVEGEGSNFRASTKGSSFTDTLKLHWKQALKDTSMIIPLSIGSVHVMNVAVRSFPVTVGRRDSISIVTPFPFGTTVHALRDIGAQASVVSPGSIATQPIGALVVDERSLSLLRVDGTTRSEIRSFASRGGHVIILRQEEDDWNANPLLSGVQLERTHEFGAATEATFNDANRLFRFPNAVDSSLWDSWLFFRAYHRVTVPESGSVEVVLRQAETGYPMIVTEKTGKGRITYVDLDLKHQMMNLHPGVLRLFANIISNRE